MILSDTKNMFHISTVLVTLFVVCSTQNETVEYFKELIPREIKRAYEFDVPRDSSAFEPSSAKCSVYGTFDYIVVGAGSAGAVIASRLSEESNVQVLLLEAGGNETDFSDIPVMTLYLQGLEFNWNYNSTPQETCCLGMINRRCPVPRGRGLGGTSIINAMMYVRGNKRDYDNWSEQGNPGWSYQEVLKYFKKSEDSHIDGDVGYHGTGGLLSVEHADYNHPQFDAFIEANLELGRKVVDYNGKRQLGVSRTQFTTINGRRDSTGKAFLRPATGRPNLKILMHSLVTKILINKLTKKAYGVNFSNKGRCYTAKVRKEIIVSAGTINSPQLLMLSGIGNFLHLAKFGIIPIQELPVGDNLQDHATYFALNFGTNYTAPVQSIEESVREYLDGRGRYTLGAGTLGIGFFQTTLETTPGYPDIELILVPSNNTNDFIKTVYHYTNESYQAVWGDVDPRTSFSLFIILLHPKSRGSIRLRTKSVYDYPDIDLRYLSDPEGKDIETMYQGILLALEMINTAAFQKLGILYCINHFVFVNIWNIFHPIGTCKMGPNRHTSVVDHELKVHGIKNLRVADASIIPDATSGHTNAPAIMIGEKVSDLIKQGR